MTNMDFAQSLPATPASHSSSHSVSSVGPLAQSSMSSVGISLPKKNEKAELSNLCLNWLEMDSNGT